MASRPPKTRRRWIEPQFFRSGGLLAVLDRPPATVFLPSPDSAWITGEILRVAGGLR